MAPSASASVASSASRAAACSADGPSATTTTEVPCGRGRAQAGEGARDVVWPVRGDQHDRGQAGRRLLESRRDAGARAVADPFALGDIGRRGRRQREVGAAIGDLPARRLDLGPQPVRLGPVTGGSSLGSRVGGRQDVVGDAATTHARPAWTTAPSFAAAAAITSSMTSRSRSAVRLNRIQPLPRFAFGSRSAHGSTPTGEA